MLNDPKNKNNYKIGIISDTHGLLRPEVFTALQGSDLIIHAGDIGDLQIIDKLEAISPVVAVRGNIDNETRAYNLKKTEVVDLGGHTFYILHDVSRLDIGPSSSHVSAVIHGHTHRPDIREHDGVLYINPGSAGPRRPRLPVTVAVLNIKGKKLNAGIVDLKQDRIDK
ncbi:MAG: metallophosphoesterase family protein [Nitrospirae bacterium]|nr:metallophosphoesterase family protein [Nitrospirota bacterium]